MSESESGQRKDLATSLGPNLVTPDQLELHRASRAFGLTMTARVNGRECSRASLAEISWSLDDLDRPRVRCVEPGDVVGSRACRKGCILELSLVYGSGVFPWLQSGDDGDLAVIPLGKSTNRIVAGPPLVTLC